MGLTEETDPVQVELVLNPMIPAGERGDFSLRMILHGRQRCSARNPDCASCEIRYRQRSQGTSRNFAREAKRFRDRIAEFDLIDRVPVLMSPVWDELDPPDLASWILEDRLHVRLQLQLHKLLWNDEPGH